MLSLFEDDGDRATCFESTTGLTTPSMRFLLQSPTGQTGDSLLWVRLPVRSRRSSRARLLLMPPCWISWTGENSGIEISSSLDAGLEIKRREKHLFWTWNSTGHHTSTNMGHTTTYLTSMDCTSSPFTSSDSSLMTGGVGCPRARGVTEGLTAPNCEPPLAIPSAVGLLCGLLMSAGL